MNRVISTGELNRIATSIINYCTDQIDALLLLPPPIYDFEADTSLQGAAWNTARGQVSNHLIVIRGAVVAHDSMREDAYTLQSVIAGEETILDERRILEAIDIANRRIQVLTNATANLFSLMMGMPEDSLEISRIVSANQSLMDDYVYLIAQLEERLQRLDEICGATQSLFVAAAGLFHDVNVGLGYLGRAWNGSMFLWNVDAPWRTNLQNAWNERGFQIVGRRDFEAGGFRYLNQDFWDCEVFFVDYWWLDPVRFAIATEVLLNEANILGGINFNALFWAYDAREANFRLQTIQALLGVPFEAMEFWDGSSTIRLERFLRGENIYVSNRILHVTDLNLILGVETLHTLIYRYANCEVWRMQRLIDANMPLLVIGCFGVGMSARAIARMRIEYGPLGKVGNFQNVRNLTDFHSRVPPNATRLPWRNVPGGASTGVKYRWTDSQGNVWNVRAHSPDPGAPAGSNASQGWVYRVEVRWGGSGKTYFMDSRGNFHPENVTRPNSPMFNEAIVNDTHIPFTQ